jgi:DNA-binding MarR family transcriptional regulator
LTGRQVRAIRTLAEMGELTQREIGALFGVTQAQVSHIVNRRQWRAA